MNTKLNRLVKTAAIGIFFMALLMNVKLSLTDPFLTISNDALAQTSSSSSGGGITCPAWGTNYGSCHKRSFNYYDDGNGHIVLTSYCYWTGYQNDFC
ncbi:hypothetical protein [Algoriphagus chordae]|uniref:Uncharacterized protein n=1 Tax=Algoriphagus chordae TaxID=237019 RepID=A0A2W7QRN3_9BACT|nr:hypothetical protein [Algoriphagus chordae]PZX48680.1 hypothetical protein LV85_03494 [Algoriphagus chordae]